MTMRPGEHDHVHHPHQHSHAHHEHHHPHHVIAASTEDPLDILDDLEGVIESDVAGLNAGYLLVVVKGLLVLTGLLSGEATLDDLVCKAKAFSEEEDAREALFPSSPYSPGSPSLWAQGAVNCSAFDAALEAECLKC